MQTSQLKEIQSLIESMAYEVTFTPRGETSIVDMLSVLLDNEDDFDTKEQKIIITGYPDEDELDGSFFMQFFSEYSFTVQDKDLLNLLNMINQVNLLLPLGAFYLGEENSKLYFKYVLAYPKESSITAAFLNDVLDMAIYAIDEFQEGFENL
jgi:hypothetical protein